MSANAASKSGITVAIRVRPLNERERKVYKSPAWKVDSDTNTIAQLDSNGQILQTNTYSFDHVFDEASGTDEVYSQSARQVVKSVMEGINATIFAYGQTSSGKTFTMNGDKNCPGIIPMAIDDIFTHIQNTPNREFLMRVSYLEIYQENLNCLLNPKKEELKISEHYERGVFVDGLLEVNVGSPQQVLECLVNGQSRRHVGATQMNADSSRSHSIFRIVVESREIPEDGVADESRGAVRVATLNLVDLAGSERVSQTKATGERLKEGGAINRSLLYLAEVIHKLSERQGAQHIPYRNSKLTRILQPALGGNSMTTIICTVTPAEMHVEETNSSLGFASRAKKISNSVKVNEIMDDQTQIKKLKAEILQLKKLVTVSENSAESSTEKQPAQKEADEETQLRLQSAEEELGKLKKFLLSSASLQVTSIDSLPQLPSGMDKKKKANRRATCDPSAFSADLFRSSLALPTIPAFGDVAGYRRGSALEMAKDLFNESIEESELESSSPSATAPAAESVSQKTLVKFEQFDDGSKSQLATLQQENEELKNRIASLEKLSHQPESNDQTLHLQGNLKQEMLLKEAALAQLQTSHQHCRTLEESIAHLKSEMSTLKSEHEKAEASWKQETTITASMRQADQQEFSRQLSSAFQEAATQRVLLQQAQESVAKLTAQSDSQLSALRTELESSKQEASAMQTKLEATEQELSETQEAFENLKVTAIEIEQQRDASLTECQTKTIMYTELEEKVKILEEQSERMQASTQSVLSSKDGKSAKDSEFEEQLRVLHVQRMDDFKTFEHKLLAKSNQLAQAQIELASSISENSKAKAELIEYKAAFEDATEQLRALSGQVQLTADETEIMSMQQQIRELQSTVELTQNDLNNEQKRMELLEQENATLKQEAEGLQEINSQLIQLQSELSQSALEIVSLRDQCKGGKVVFSAATGNLSSISQKDLEKLKAKLEAAEGKVKQSSQDKAAWTAEKAQLDNQVKKLTKSNQLLEKENEKAQSAQNIKAELTTALKATEKKLEAATKMSAKFEADAYVATNERDRLQTLMEQRANEISSLQSELASDREKFQQKSAKYESEINSMTTTTTELEQTCRDLDLKLKVTTEELTHLQSQHESFLQEFESMNNEMLTLRESDALLQSELDDNKQSVAELQNACEQLESSLAESESRFRSQTDELNERIEFLSAELSNTSSALEESQSSFSTASAEIVRLTEAVKQSTQQIDQSALDLSASENALSELRIRSQLLETQFTHSESQRQEQAKQLREAEAQLSSCQSELFELQAKVQLSTDSANTLKVQVAELTSENERLRQRVQESTELTNHLQLQLNSGCDQAIQWHEARTAFQKQVSGLQSDLKSAQTSLTELQSKYDDASMQLRMTSSRLETEKDALNSAQETVSSLQSQLEYAQKNADSYKAQFIDAVKNSRQSTDAVDELSSKIESLESDVKYRTQQANEARSSMEKSQREQSEKLFQLQQHCGKLEGERQVLKERLAEFEDGLNKCKTQSQEFAAKLAQSRKSEGSVRSELEKSKDELESTKRDLNDRIDKVARLSAELDKIKRHLSSGSTSKLELAPVEVAVERAAAVSEPAAAPSAESTNILGALANGLSAEAQKRVLSKLVMATRKVYRGSSSSKTTDDSGSQVKENICP